MYHALNHRRREIRLLLLRPGQKDSQIEVQVAVYRLPTVRKDVSEEGEVYQLVGQGMASDALTPYYEALSYEWGDPQGRRHSISVDGQPFAIRENLFQALSCLRPQLKAPAASVPLWIDAISIDQGNIQERNHQVQMMASIYRFAGKVRVWLGSDTNGISEAFRFILDIAAVASGDPANARIVLKKVQDPNESRRHNDYDHRRSIFTRFSRGTSPTKALANKASNSLCAQDNWVKRMKRYLKSTSKHKEAWEGIIELVHRSYWTRIWIVQEFMLAQQIILCCGMQTIDGSDLEMAFTCIRLLRSEKDLYPVSWKTHIYTINKSVGTRIIDMRFENGSRSLVQLLDATKDSKCQDMHDRIYAIIGLADDTATFYGSIPIDYGRSIFRVKMDVAWAIHQRTAFDSAYITRICSLLDEIFAGVPDPDEE